MRFLDAQVEAGLSEEALQPLLPQERTATLSLGSTGLLVRGGDGKYAISPEYAEDGWRLDRPISMVDRGCVAAYARWWSEQTGRLWRPLTELEWEKAARGVDGRFFPWGDGMDPSRCHMAQSHPDKPAMAAFDTYPEDISPYGIRGMGGNLRGWCGDNPLPNRAPRLDNQIAVVQPLPDLDASREVVTRGGSWYSLPDSARAATRQWCSPAIRSVFIGFRLCTPIRSDS